MSYIIPYSQFLKKYPKDQLIPLGSGAYGQVFTTRKRDVAIKRGSIEGVLEDIDIMAQFEHPNIIHMEALSFDFSTMTAMIVMPIGVPLEDYIDKLHISSKDIEFKRIFFELVCGLRAMEDVGIVHGDIKPENIIILRKTIGMKTTYHPVYIDFGIANYTTPVCINGACDQMFSAKGFRYTSAYREPQYLPERLNSYKGDIYALAKTIEALLYGDVYLSSLPMTTDNSNLNDLLAKMLAERAKRPTAEVLMQHPYFDSVRQFCTKGMRIIPLIFAKTNMPIKEDLWYEVIYDILEWVIEKNWTMRALFLVIHNMHRSLIALSSSSWTIKMKDRLYLLSLCNLALIGSLLMGDTYTDENERGGPILRRYRIIGSTRYTSQEFIEALHICLEALGGPVITVTYWDKAKSGEVLISMLEATISWSYKGPNNNDWTRIMGYSLSQQPISTVTKNLTTALISTWMNNIQLLASSPTSSGPGRVLKNIVNMPQSMKYTEISKNILTNTDADLITPLPIKSYREMMFEYEFDIYDSLGYVYALQDQMIEDTELANHILHSLMNVDKRQRPYAGLYDIIFDKKKLTLFGEDLYNLPINAYTASYGEILEALDKA